jgi:hypothetical protein
MTPPARFAALLSVALLLAPSAAAQAQSPGTNQGTAPDPQDATSPGDARRPDDIVVTAPRYGEARVAAETEFGEDEIAGQGADDIQDLLTRLAPFIGNRGEDEPVLLVNGRPAEGDRSILSYPAEALRRLAVLKPEAAAHYGYPPGRRVVNLVLKQHFSSLNLDTGGWAATGGGQYGGDFSVARVAIDGPTRWNLQARIGRDSALYKNARSIAPATGAFDTVGYVTAPDGAEIDPALSLAVGHRVTLAAIPSDAPPHLPALADFAANADRAHPADPNAFETLLPSKRSLLLSAGITRPIGEFSASFALNASSVESEGLRGLPMASALIPAGSPWSPFAGDVLLVRPLAGERALRNDNSTQALGVSLTLTGRIADWQVTLSGNYSRSWTDSLFESGIDTSRVQALIGSGDPAFDPYGRWGGQLLLARRNRSRGEGLSTRLNVIRTIVTLPAGPLTANVSIDAGRNGLEGRSSGPLAGAAAVSDRRSSRIDGQVAFNLPLSRRGKGGAGPLGDLALDLFAGGQSLSGSSLQKRFGAGLTWSPDPVLQLRGTLEDIEATPTPDQLDGPVLTTINRIYDYARQESVDAVWILGGNPNLGRGRRQSRALTAMVRPLGDQALTLNFGYGEQVAKGGVAPFPELMPAIEAAFPERVRRDAAGHLVSVDARPINLLGDASAELTSGVALRLPRLGRGRPVPANADPVRWTLSLTYRRRLKSELLTRAGLPAIDQLGRDSGQPRDFASLQLTAGKRGVGATLSGNWSGPAALASPGGRDYRFAPASTFNLAFFIEPEHGLLGARKLPWLKNVKLSLDVRNLLDGYRRVTLGDGGVPAGYSHDEIDPLGRTVRLAIRKRF